MRESENRPRSARRACTYGSESDDSCAPVCIATSRVCAQAAPLKLTRAGPAAKSFLSGAQ